MAEQVSRQGAGLGPHKKRGFARVIRNMKKSSALYVMLLLPVVYFLIWHYWPMYGLIIAFKDYRVTMGFLDSPWVGFEHFERFFNSFRFWRLIENTVGISVYGLIVGIPAPIILALMFNELRQRRLKSFFQTVSYAPNFISVVVVAGIILFFLNPSTGVVNTVLEKLGFERIAFLAEPKYFWHIIVWSDIWQTVGWGSLIYFAAIQSIPAEQYEAAFIDGASKLQKIWHITLPNLLPTIVILSILAMSQIMNVGFEKILLLQNPSNLERSQVIQTYVYEAGILQGQHSFATAVGLFNNVINFILLIVANQLAKKAGQASLW